MRPEDLVALIRSAVSEERWWATPHAEFEMADDNVSGDMLAFALKSTKLELIEDYPEDKRGHSHLLLGWLPDESPCHICCAIHDARVIIITVYRPDASRWTSDWRFRL